MGIIDGKWKGFYSTGNDEYIANYKNGLKDGYYAKHFSNGNPGIKCNYTNGLLTGSYEVYHNKGIFIREKGEYKVVAIKPDSVRAKLKGTDVLSRFRTKTHKSVKTGKWIVFWDGTDRANQEVSYNDGMYHGKFTNYYSNGELKSIVPYKNGRRNGKAKFYNKKGEMLKKVKYKDDNTVK